MDRKMGMQRGQAEKLVSQAKQKLKYDLIEGKVGLDRAYSLVNSMKMVESQWQKMAGSQPQNQNAGQAGGSQPRSQPGETDIIGAPWFFRERGKPAGNESECPGIPGHVGRSLPRRSEYPQGTEPGGVRPGSWAGQKL